MYSTLNIRVCNPCYKSVQNFKYFILSKRLSLFHCTQSIDQQTFPNEKFQQANIEEPDLDLLQIKDLDLNKIKDELVSDISMHSTQLVDFLKVVKLTQVDCLSKGYEALLSELQSSQASNKYTYLRNGLVRFEVQVPISSQTPLEWLKDHRNFFKENISVYYSSRLSSAPGSPGTELAQQNTCQLQSFGGIGAAWMEDPTQNWRTQYKSIQRFLKRECPEIRAFIALRFDGDGDADPEWREFERGLVMIPAIEFKQENQFCVLSATLAWNSDRKGHTSYDQASLATQKMLEKLLRVQYLNKSNRGVGVMELDDLSYDYVPNERQWKSHILSVINALEDDYVYSSKSQNVDDSIALNEFLGQGQGGLDDLLAAAQLQKPRSIHQQLEQAKTLTKVVLGRLTRFSYHGVINPLGVLQILAQKDPRAYQMAILHPSGAAFISSTPERLYVRSGRDVASEAVAGTRPRGPKGDLQQDFMYSLDLLQSPKDHAEFCAVRDWVREALESISDTDSVCVEREKSLLKQEAVQHLYGCLAGRIKRGISDGDILSVLHPTPAVCGRPQILALKKIRQIENFDRGLYGGPMGWVSGQAAEIAVAIRSTLFKSVSDMTTEVRMYSGVGIVKNSQPQQEWNELDLKIKQYQKILLPLASVFGEPNVNLVWTHLIFEEFARLGVDTICIAPGSRSSPLVLAAASNPLLKIVTCIDERSLGFWALGYGKARRRPAVIITSSGTAVANLLPSIVEASQSNVPVIVCTADRPLELRNTCANQTIDQVGIYGPYVRYECDLDAPNVSVPARMVLTTVDTVYRYATGSQPGPVHMNCQFREPLALREVAWEGNGDFMKGIDKWEKSLSPFTSCQIDGILQRSEVIGEQLLEAIKHSERGIFVIGELEDQAQVHGAAKLVRSLGWPVVADVLSGLRVGNSDLNLGQGSIISHMDHILLAKENWQYIQPDTILLLGSHLTSKRVQQFLDWCVLESPHPSRIIQSTRYPRRNDPSHNISQILLGEVPILSSHVKVCDKQLNYNEVLYNVNQHIERCITNHVNSRTINEPQIAYTIAQMLPQHHALFMGNSMPIRDMDMYSQPRHSQPTEVSIGVPIASNRGASGIDGVLSTAVGFASGHARPTTLVIGDVSFLHDTNGFTFLSSSSMQAASSTPVTVVAINNNGGGIFHFLPLAQSVPKENLDHLWTTPQYVDIGTLCKAHGVLHAKIEDIESFEEALRAGWRSNQHNVIEVVTNRDQNHQFHNELQAMSSIATNRAFRILTASRSGKIVDFQYKYYSIQLAQPLTTEQSSDYRQGIVVQLSMQLDGGDTVRGRGEVAPLPGLHRETLDECKGQIAALSEFMINVQLPVGVLMLNGSFDRFWQEQVGIDADVLLPSVRFGIEMAILDVIGLNQKVDGTEVLMNGLIGNCELNEAVEQAKNIVATGKQCIKIKVGNRGDPLEDAAVVAAIRQAVGKSIILRADANRRWNLEEALVFGQAAYEHNLQYIEEPLNDPQKFENFYLATGISYALDETLDDVIKNRNSSTDSVSQLLQKAVNEMDIKKGLRGVVLKPMLLGSADEILETAEWAKDSMCQVVVSSCFETPIGINQLKKLASRVDETMNQQQFHGLDTLNWFRPESLFDRQTKMNENLNFSFVQQNYMGTFVKVDGKNVKTIQFVGEVNQPSFFFLHGMFGSASDWIPIMRQIHAQTGCTCIGVDFHQNKSLCSIQAMTEAVEGIAHMLKMKYPRLGLVGYSMGGRVALNAIVNNLKQQIFDFGVIISSSPGIEEDEKRKKRLVVDIERAKALCRYGSLREYLDEMWYMSGMWGDIRSNARYQDLLERRSFGDIQQLSRTFVMASPGIQLSLWKQLKDIDIPLLLVVGKRDEKYCQIYDRMMQLIRECQVVKFDAGHAIPFEKPLELSAQIIEFFQQDGNLGNR